MTKEGYKSVLISEEIYNKMVEAIKEHNKKLGYKDIRSKIQFVDMAIKHEIEKRKEKEIAP